MAGVDVIHMDSGEAEAQVGPPLAGAPRDPGVRATVRWASGLVLGMAALLFGAVLWRTGGRFVYVLDDPAIHLTVARRLAYDGTWGIVAGEFQAASSSPLWTLLLAPTQVVVRGTAGELVPLVLNLLAALWVVRLLGPDLHAVLRPSRRRPVDVAATAAVVGALLFLPGLAFFGMEHTLHMALVLATVLAVERRWVSPTVIVRSDDGSSADHLRNGGDRPSMSGRMRGLAGRLWDEPPAWLPLALMTLATLARGESAFVAAGLAVALLVVGVTTRRRNGTTGAGAEARPGTLRDRLGVVAGLAIAASVGLGVVAAVNVAFGQGLLPNSVLAKAFGDRGDTRRSLVAALDRLVTDPLLLALGLLALVVVVREWRRTRDSSGGQELASPAGHPIVRAGLVFPATVLILATLLHVELAAVESSLRYEAYLLGIGVLVLLRLLADLGFRPGPLPAAGRRRLAGALLVAVLVPAVAQVWRTLIVPRDAGVMWEQRYQVARFLDRAYDTEPIAIGELGYIGLYHDGPLTDVYGLGDHEVLEATLDDRKDTDFWRRLQSRRDFPVMVTYDFSLGGQQPREWFLVATWRSPDAFFEVTQFWATVPEEVVPLLDQLEAYESELPDGVEVTYNHLSAFAAGAAMADPG